MEFQQNWMLPALIAIPFIAGLLCWVVERFNKRLPRWIALIGMMLTFALTLVLWQSGQFAGMSEQAIGAQAATPWTAQFVLPWIPDFGISFHLAMDGMSLLMIGLTGLLGVAAVACSWNEIQRRVGFFHLNLLWSLGGVIGVFLAIDMFLFFFFWEMMLVPIYFLIALWGHDVVGGKTKEYAATKFFIYTQASGLIMLVGILMLVLINYNYRGAVSFNYNDLLGTPLGGWEYPIMLCFFIGFAVKLPVMPFHGWLPDAHAQAPTAGSVDLAGVLIKTAAYGLIRFVLPLFPAASQEFAPIAITLGTIGIFYGAWLAFMQTDMKRLLAYTSISHMGFVVLAIYVGSLLSLQGLMIQMLAHGLSSAALFIMAGQIYERLHTRDLTLMGGMWGQFRYYAPVLMFFCAALLGIPGTGNFIGEFMILLGSFAAYPTFVVLATISLVLAGLYSLILIYRALFGQNNIKQVAFQATKQHGLPERRLKDLGKRELSLLLLLAAGLIWLGLYPQPILDTSSHAMQWISNAYVYSDGGSINTQLLDAMEAR
ncbi:MULTISPECIES: NADH-quinone oxidoreductase subunit M [unclassified Psychrobacter]|uniref:NADH-quinone oxidoreductase subunit M n=1 Tax=unclassified Psychrobacter TaxID=196806 RepID=UPI0018F38A72|nr:MULTISPECIES: NADH-quinone oxidoreductase subunit M [unclassified Psychrobacter]